MDVLDPVLESALEQEFRGELPSELDWDRLRPRARGVAWRSAALLLLGLGLVVAIWGRVRRGDQTADQEVRPDPLPWHENLVIPHSADEAMQLLTAHDRLDVRVFAVRDPSTGGLVDVLPNPFWRMLGSLFGNSVREPRVQADREQDATWTAAVAALIAGPGAAADAFAALPLELMFHIPASGTLVVGLDDTVDPMRIQVRGLPLSWTVARDHPLARTLRTELQPVLVEFIAREGLAILRKGLDALPDDVTSIRAVSLQAADLATLARFRSLTSIDLTLSPDAATPVALRALAGCPLLRSVVLPSSGIGADHLAPIVGLPRLGELFVGDPWRMMSRPVAATVHEAIVQENLDDRCATLLTGASGLKELFLPFTAMTDDGLAQLAALPLRSITIGSPRITGRGFAAFAGHQTLRSLGLVRCPALDVAGLRAVGAALGGTPAQVALSDCGLSPEGVAAILSSKRVRELSLLRCTSASRWSQVFDAMATAGPPGKLVLNLAGGLSIDDLAPLGSAPGFERLEMSVTGEATKAELERRLKAALPGVHIDLYLWPQ